MGNTTSKDIINNIINTVSTKTQSTCKTDSSNLQSLDISNINIKGCKSVIFSNIGQTINSSVNANCYKSDEFKNLLKEDAKDIINKLYFDVKPATLTKIRNTVTNNQFIEDVSSCMASSSNSQFLNIGNITFDCAIDGEFKVENISQTITNKLLNDCFVKIAPNLITELSQETQETQLPKDTQETQLPKDTQDTQLNNATYTNIGIGIGIGILILMLIMLIILVVLIKKKKQ